MHFFGDLTGAVCLLDDYVWRTTQYHYRGQNREHREDDQTKPVINKNEIIISIYLKYVHWNFILYVTSVSNKYVTILRFSSIT